MTARLRLLAMLCGMLLSRAGAANEDISQRYNLCQMKYGEGCIAYVAVPRAMLRAEPRSTSSHVAVLTRGAFVLLFGPSSERDGWVETYTVTKQGTAKAVWVARADLVMPWELRRVVGCWPVVRLKWTETDEGGEPVVYEARVSGEGVATVENRTNTASSSAYRVFLGRGIFVLAEPGNPPSKLDPVFLIDLDGKRVSADLGMPGKLWPSQWTATEPGKCGREPTVDPTATFVEVPGRAK